ncbi:hypothetical protein [Nitrosomonas sp.]|uniref:hypothetical protein n=1 Tax=Nitrosomonas sp. TaxID=42353 RepID=UPI0035AF5759
MLVINLLVRKRSLIKNNHQRGFDFCKMLLFQPALQFAGSECIDGAQLLGSVASGRFQADPVNIELLNQSFGKPPDNVFSQAFSSS